MSDDIEEIIDTFKVSRNEHLMWFGRLLEKIFEGIIAHGPIRIASSKIEGINNKIKTQRRQG